jgi:hypothetical protein
MSVRDFAMAAGGFGLGLFLSLIALAIARLCERQPPDLYETIEPDGDWPSVTGVPGVRITHPEVR